MMVCVVIIADKIEHRMVSRIKGFANPFDDVYPG